MRGLPDGAELSSSDDDDGEQPMDTSAPIAATSKTSSVSGAAKETGKKKTIKNVVYLAYFAKVVKHDCMRYQT